MNRFVLYLALPMLFVAGSAFAESPITNGGVGADSIISGPNTYEQAMRRYQDPNAMVRAKAEFRAAQRMRRIESLKWYGLSNARPQVNGDPFHSDYAPHWVANPGYYPSRWNGVGQNVVTGY
jgi:hypothetical protein